jgi:hypothetical protein
VQDSLPSPQRVVPVVQQLLGIPAHCQFVSVWQVEEQPSLLILLPSSHCSPVQERNPSPHVEIL